MYPWYKERLHNKLKHLSRKNKKNYLSTHGWNFMKPGMDDFRAGCPQVDSAKIESHKSGDIMPNFVNLGRRVKYKHPTKMTDQEAHFSCKNVAAERKRKLVEKYENELMKHPIIVFEHLQNCLSRHLLDMVIEATDPEMKEALDCIKVELSNEFVKPETREQTTFIDELESPVEDYLVDYFLQDLEKSDNLIECLNEMPPNSKMDEIAKPFVEYLRSMCPEAELNFDVPTLVGLFKNRCEGFFDHFVIAQIMPKHEIPTILRDQLSSSNSSTNFLLSPDISKETSAREDISENEQYQLLLKKSRQLNDQLSNLEGPKMFEKFVQAKRSGGNI